MHTEPRPEHQWLHRMVGKWTYEAVMGDIRTTGLELVTSLGGLWILGQGIGDMPGGAEGQTRLTLGYDTSRNRFAGSWVGSMMDCIFFYEGWLEDDVLTLECEGPAFADDGSMHPSQRAMYRDVYTMPNDDERILSSRHRNDDGSWAEFMRTTYRRDLSG